MRYTTKRSGGPECEVGNVLCAEKLAPCMSEMGHSRRFLDTQLTSASPSIAVIGVRRSERRDGPISDIGVACPSRGKVQLSAYLRRKPVAQQAVPMLRAQTGNATLRQLRTIGARLL